MDIERAKQWAQETRQAVGLARKTCGDPAWGSQYEECAAAVDAICGDLVEARTEIVKLRGSGGGKLEAILVSTLREMGYRVEPPQTATTTPAPPPAASPTGNAIVDKELTDGRRHPDDFGGSDDPEEEVLPFGPVDDYSDADIPGDAFDAEQKAREHHQRCVKIQERLGELTDPSAIRFSVAFVLDRPSEDLDILELYLRDPLKSTVPPFLGSWTPWWQARPIDDAGAQRRRKIMLSLTQLTESGKKPPAESLISGLTDQQCAMAETFLSMPFSLEVPGILGDWRPWRAPTSMPLAAQATPTKAETPDARKRAEEAPTAIADLTLDPAQIANVMQTFGISGDRVAELLKDFKADPAMQKEPAKSRWIVPFKAWIKARGGK